MSRILQLDDLGPLLGAPPTARGKPAVSVPLFTRVDLPRTTYGLMMSLLRATATVVGTIMRAQIPTPIEMAGVTLVVVGVALRRPGSR